MQHTEVDHLVVVAHDLTQGAVWCEATLGVAPHTGGRHALMSTHNLLLATGSTAYPQSYLEIIAIDPDAPAPQRRRWFGMDEAALQARVRQAPELVGFVARSQMLDMHRWGLINCGHVPGPVLKASRETAAGLLQWQIVVPDDGAMLAGGAVPLLIQWQGRHPAENLPPSPVHLAGIAVRGMPDKAAQVLRLRPLERPVTQGPALSVRLQTPLGIVHLDTAAAGPERHA